MRVGIVAAGSIPIEEFLASIEGTVNGLNGILQSQLTNGNKPQQLYVRLALARGPDGNLAPAVMVETEDEVTKPGELTVQEPEQSDGDADASTN